MSATRRVAIAAAVVVVVSVAIAVVVGRADDTPSESPLVIGVCRVAALAADGDRAEAGRVFTNEVHGPLHELAAAAQSEDRGAAARLLEVKARMEASPAGPTESDAEELVTATVQATRAIGEESTGC